MGGDKMKQTSKNVSPFSNEARNTYVIEHITDALLKLLEEKSIADISISELCCLAGVGRVSFYRNFESKEDILRKHLKNLLDEWSEKYDGKENFSMSEAVFNRQEAIFEYFYQNRDLYIMLYRQGLSHISLQSIIDACGPKPEQPNALAYVANFIAYGLYGWVEEWFKRGAQETPKEMIELYEHTQHSDSQ